ncbi:MAG: hypothetical protein ACRYG7_50250 [Janthinobacterium lividum]
MKKLLFLFLTTVFLLLACLVVRKLLDTHQPWHLAIALVGLAIAAAFGVGILREQAKATH